MHAQWILDATENFVRSNRNQNTSFVPREHVQLQLLMKITFLDFTSDAVTENIFIFLAITPRYH